MPRTIYGVEIPETMDQELITDLDRFLDDEPPWEIEYEPVYRRFWPQRDSIAAMVRQFVENDGQGVFTVHGTWESREEYPESEGSVDYELTPHGWAMLEADI